MAAKPLPNVLGALGRTFWIEATDLIPTRRWHRTDYLSGPASSSFSCTIHCIGKDADVLAQFKDRAPQLHLTLKSDEARAEEWKRTLADQPNYVPDARWADEPPTACAFQDDRQPESLREWWLECAVSPLVLKQLEADIATGGVKQLSIGIEWAAPDHDISYYGRVESVQWTVPARELRAAEAANAEKKTDTRLRELVSVPLSGLSSTVTFGLIAVLALLLIGDLRVILSGWIYAILSVGIGAFAIYLSWQLEQSAARRRERQQIEGE